MADLSAVSKGDQTVALTMSTVAFTVCFAVWTIFSIIGVRIQQELGLTDTQLGLLAGTPILTGSLSRVILGIWADQLGGRLTYAITMLLAALAAFLLSYASTYETMVLAGLGLGLAGGAFAVGVSYVSKWFPPSKQGTALGIFGAGNIGSAVTKLVAPFVMLAFGWQMVAQIWAVALAVMAVIFYVTTKDDPELRVRRAEGRKAETLAQQLEPLKNLQVWRFSLYYFFVFGAFVALALWLPHYLMGVYGLDIGAAGVLAALFSIPASLFRAYGGHLADRYGARAVMYVTFGVSLVCTLMLSYPHTDYLIHGIRGPIAFSTQMDLVPFLVLIFILGFFMSLGKAAVYRHIPTYYPKNVGSVGGLVGMIGGLGGFVLPIVFGAMNDLTNIWTSCFMLLFLIVGVSLAWMHISIQIMERRASTADLKTLPELPEMLPLQEAGLVKKPREPDSHILTNWRPEDRSFWDAKGKPIASRNLWISITCLLLSFAVWMVWSMVVAKLPSIGFAYTTDQLFWLAALPGLSGATLRIFYSFMVPIFGGRLWTTLTTASLMLPAFGIGYAVQDPSTPYVIFLILALLCGLGGGNFASSMANISFFFPKREKGNALALNGGLGNLGVSIMQFLVPLVITVGVFGGMGGDPHAVSETTNLWVQNAGFIWVPFIMAATLLAWFGMNDIADAKASLRDQAVIFGRRDTWLMCWLYTGTFGSFIGYSAAFPLLAATEFPQVNSLQFVFLGPLLGALARAGTGWIADRWGGGRVTFWTFILMMVALSGVMYFLSIKQEAYAFWGYFGCFMVLFLATGIGNSSTFQMIPNIMGVVVARKMPGLTVEEARREADTESAAIIGFTSAIAAYGAFYIPKAYGSAIELTGSAMPALYGFFIFYVSCAALTWFAYTRPGGLLHAIERGRPAPSAPHNRVVGKAP